MTYKFEMQTDNVYVIDTKMFGFDNYSSSYLVKGKELVMIDTGLPNQLDAVHAGIQSHGFSVSDISKVFVSHAHEDHSGNTGPILRESPKASVYINPVALEFLTTPSIEDDRRKKELPADMQNRFGTMEPVPRSRIQLVNDGDVFDIGDGVTLRIRFTTGHQPSGMIIFEEKNGGLFINDLVGNYFSDADYLQVLAPFRFDILESMKLLKEIISLPLKKLFLGHFGICNEPKKLIQRALDGMQQMMDIGAECVAKGKPEQIEPRILAIKKIEVEKLRNVRDAEVFKHESQELIVSQAKSFAAYYLQLHKDHKLS